MKSRTTVRLPDGTQVNELKVTVLDPGRTPVDLPESHFSTTIVQLTPFGARITPGGKLTFPNTDSLPTSSTATLLRYDQTAGSATLGQFVSAGSATVTADGLRVETARDAIKEATYYFVSVARTTATIYGSVVEEDDTPARGALVQVRGKSVFALTDDNGAFILTNVPVLGSEQLTLEVSYLRPDGTVDRTERAGIRPGGSALTFVSPPIVLTGRGRTRAPAILAPRFLTIEAGKPADFNFIAFARGTQTSLRSVTVAGASFASVNALGEDRYNLRLAPGTSVTGNFTLTVTARDSQDASTTEAVIAEVKAANTNQPIANSQSLITNEDSPLPLSLQGSGGTVYRSWMVTISVDAKWAGTSQIEAAEISSFATQGIFLFAGTLRDGVYRTMDNGVSWTAVNGGLGSQIVTALTVKDNALFAGTLTGTVYRTTDNGASWTRAHIGLELHSVRALTVKDNALFAGTGFGVYCTTDNGDSWTQINNGMGVQRVFALAVKENALFAGTTRGVYRTTDNGENWIPVNSGLGNQDVSALTFKENALLAGTTTGVYVLAESAATWTESNSGLINRNINAAMLSEDNFIAGTFGGGAFRSPDKGQSWSPASIGLPPAADVRAFTPSGNGVLAGLAGDGVYFSNDQGRSWTARNTGLTNKLVNALAGDGETVYAGTNGGVFRSGDGGANWTAANSGLTRSQVLSLAISGGAIYAGTDNGLFRSTNQGASWTEVSAGLTDRYIVSLGVAPNGTALLAGTSSGLFRASSLGNQVPSWTPVTNGVPERVVALTFVQKGTTLLMGSVNGFFVSEDNGASWQQINGGLLTLQVGALAVSGDTVLAGTRSGGVFVSTLP